MAIGASAILGWYIILGLLFSIQDLDATIATETKQPVAQVCDPCPVLLIFNEFNVSQIFLDTVGEKGAIVLMVSVRVSL